MTKRSGVPVKLWLDEETLALLRSYCRRRGVELLPECIASILKECVEGQAAAASPDMDRVVRRIERVVQDLLNPFTGKIDEINRRLSELVEALEASAYREEERESIPAPQAPKARGPVERSRRGSAIERLKAEGVVFEDDVRWMRAPERFFQKLEREGAVVLDVQGEKVAVDPDFWREFLEFVEALQVSDLTEASDIVEEKLGPQASKLFRKLARAGLLHYNEETGSWEASESLEA